MGKLITCYFDAKSHFEIFYHFRYHGMTIPEIAQALRLEETVVQCIVKKEMRKAMGQSS